MKISEIIKQKRLGKRMTQAQLAERINVRRATIVDLENEKRDTPRSVIQKCFDELHIKLS